MPDTVVCTLAIPTLRLSRRSPGDHWPRALTSKQDKSRGCMWHTYTHMHTQTHPTLSLAWKGDVRKLILSSFSLPVFSCSHLTEHHTSPLACPRSPVSPVSGSGGCAGGESQSPVSPLCCTLVFLHQHQLSTNTAREQRYEIPRIDSERENLLCSRNLHFKESSG